MSAAIGQNGRHWPKSVPFIAYLIQTMKGLADDSRTSSSQSKTDHLETMGAEGAGADDALGRLQHHQPDFLTQAVEAEEEQDRHNHAQFDAGKIDEYFAGDSEVTWIIMGHKDGQSAADIQKLAEMTQTQYETARRRFRRGLEKLFPGRSKR